MVSKLKLKPAECHTAAQCSVLPMLCSAYVGRIGLLGSNVLFSTCQSGCVCVLARMRVCVCVYHEGMCPVFKGTSRNTNQQSITKVIDELWQTAATVCCLCVCLYHSVQAHVLCIHMWMIFYSTDVTAPGHTHLNKKTHRWNLKPRAWMGFL